MTTTVHCRAILFDLDGVLVDSRRCIEQIWRDWAGRHGMDAEAIIRVAHGRRTSETLREVAPTLDIDTEVALLDRMEETETRGVATAAGALSLIRSLSGERWAVVTSGSPTVARLRLGLGGIPAPPVLITAADMARGKPAPDGYLLAAEALAVAPAQCVVVEDAPAGIAAGRAAGMRVIAVRGTYSAERLTGADVVVTGLTAIRARAVDAGFWELDIAEGGVAR